MLQKTRILIIGYAVHPSGYARVINHIFGHLQDDYELHQFGTNYHGAPVHQGWPIYPNRLDTKKNGPEQVVDLIQKIDPQILFFLGDWGPFSQYHAHFRKIDSSFKVVFYTPIDGHGIDPNLFRIFDGVDHLVLFTHFAHQEVQKAFASIRKSEHPIQEPSISILPHGIEKNVFFPLTPLVHPNALQENRRKARALLFPNQPQLQDAFIILNANQNTMRKQINLSVEAFAMFAHDKPKNVKLFILHPSSEMSNYLQVAEKYGIADRIMGVESLGSSAPISDETLNLLYNACEIDLNTAIGEGWGLIHFEHAATGGAQIVPDNSIFPELWQDAALFAETRGIFRRVFEYQIVFPPSVTRAMRRLYDDPDLLQEQSLRAYRHATAAKFEWANIAKQWQILFDQMLVHESV